MLFYIWRRWGHISGTGPYIDPSLSSHKIMPVPSIFSISFKPYTVITNSLNLCHSYILSHHVHHRSSLYFKPFSPNEKWNIICFHNLSHMLSHLKMRILRTFISFVYGRKTPHFAILPQHNTALIIARFHSTHLFTVDRLKNVTLAMKLAKREWINTLARLALYQRSIFK